MDKQRLEITPSPKAKRMLERIKRNTYIESSVDLFIEFLTMLKTEEITSIFIVADTKLNENFREDAVLDITFFRMETDEECFEREKEWERLKELELEESEELKKNYEEYERSQYLKLHEKYGKNS